MALGYLDCVVVVVVPVAVPVVVPVCVCVCVVVGAQGAYVDLDTSPAACASFGLAAGALLHTSQVRVHGACGVCSLYIVHCTLYIVE